MPIITPNYPSMCATHNVTKSTKKVILREMNRAHEIVTSIMMKKASWNKLFERHTFFTQDYKYYLRVIAAARTKEEALKWSGLVESKVRHFVGKLEMVPNVDLAHPFNRTFDDEFTCSNEDEAYNIARGQNIEQSQAGEGDEGSEKLMVYTSSHYLGLVLDTSAYNSS